MGIINFLSKRTGGINDAVKTVEDAIGLYDGFTRDRKRTLQQAIEPEIRRAVIDAVDKVAGLSPEQKQTAEEALSNQIDHVMSARRIIGWLLRGWKLFRGITKCTK